MKITIPIVIAVIFANILILGLMLQIPENYSIEASKDYDLCHSYENNDKKLDCFRDFNINIDDTKDSYSWREGGYDSPKTALFFIMSVLSILTTALVILEYSIRNKR